MRNFTYFNTTREFHLRFLASFCDRMTSLKKNKLEKIEFEEVGNDKNKVYILEYIGTGPSVNEPNLFK
mgnify:CR=1 FL=1